MTINIDMSTMHTCFDLGDGYKVEDILCTKCTCRSNNEMFYWEWGSIYNCMHTFCGADDRCRRFRVKYEEGIDRRISTMLKDSIGIDRGGDIIATNRVEKRVARKYKLTCDTTAMNKTIYLRYLECVLNLADQTL